MAGDDEDAGLREQVLGSRMFRVFQVMSNELSVPQTML